MRHEVEPEIKPAARAGETTETHPAYGQIQGSRVQGSRYLYGSDFLHHNYVAIRIFDSTLDRHLSSDWPHQGRQHIEVALSEAQWANLVSSLNSGSGTQCTIDWTRETGALPGIALPTDRYKQIHAEFDEDTREAREALAALTKDIEALPLSKVAKERLLASAGKARRALTSSIQFVTEQFDEHVENTVQKARIEVNAAVEAAVQRAGLRALGDGAFRPLELTTGSATEVRPSATWL